MADINLLQNTTGDEGKKKPKKEKPNIKYTDPSVEPKEKEAEPKLKRSGIFGGLFRKKPKETIPEKDDDKSTPAFQRTETPPVSPTNRTIGKTKGNEINESSFLEEKVQKKTEKKKKDKDKKKKKEEVAADTEDIPPFMGVNLMPGDLIESLEPKRKLIIYSIVIIVSVALITGLYVGLNYYENNIYQDVEDISKEIQDIEGEIRGLREKQRSALLLKSQTDQVKDMLDNQIHWSNFFKLLEKYTMQEVVYTQFTGSISRGTNPTFALSAQGSDYRSISRQLMAFREADDFISDVIITSGQRGETESGTDTFVTFPIQITVFEDIFYNRLDDLATEEEGE